MGLKVLSIEIGLLTTKICEVEYKKTNPHICRTLIFDTPENTVEDGYIRDKEVFGAVLNQSLTSAKMRQKDVIFTISSTKLVNCEVMIPYVKDSRIQEIVHMNAQDYFSNDVSDCVFSYQILERIGKRDEKKLKLLLLAAPSNLIQNYYSFSELMGFHIEAIDYVGNSFFQMIKGQIEEEISLAVQINEETTIISVIEKEILILQRMVPYGTRQVIEAVLENPIFGVKTEQEAVLLLHEESMLNHQFNLATEESPGSFSVVSETYDKILKEIQGKEEVTETLRFIVNNISRVLDYYGNQFPDKRVECIYISGSGINMKGITHLIRNEISLQIKRVEELSWIRFDKDIALEKKDQMLFLSCIGATIEPIGFFPKGIIGRKKKSILYLWIVLDLSIALSGFLIVTSYLDLNTAARERDNLQSEVEKKSYVQSIFDEYDQAESQYNDLLFMYNRTKSQSEDLETIMARLEENFPVDVKVISFTMDRENVKLDLSAAEKASVAKLLIQLQNLKGVHNVNIPSLEEKKDKKGKTFVAFSLTFQYKE